VFLGKPLGTVPVLAMHVHQNCLARLAGIHKLALGLRKTAFVLQRHSVLEVHVRKLPLGCRTRKLKGKVKRAGIACKLSATPG
jgi:hypothetical protein